jgi:hypothetical protein
VSLRRRLGRLEETTARHNQALPRVSLSDQIEQRLAYLRGEGPRPPDPPCPSWFAPHDWASRMRVSRCSEGRLAGVLQPGQYLPDMDEEECRYVDGLAAAFAVFLHSQAHEPGCAVGGIPS